MLALLGILVFLAQAAVASPQVYVGRLTATSAILAWGDAAAGGNSIGRGAKPMGRAEVTVGDRKITTDRAWLDVQDLQPDTEYPYTVRVAGVEIGNGHFRTWPVTATKIRFFVIGDYGNGSPGQYDIARVMEQRRESNAAEPPRFVITTGDNIYGVPLGFTAINSGDRDIDWLPKFFRPYAPLIASVPFYPSLGNHDTGQTESKGDLPVYLDNFFFPADPPARYYQFSIGGLADFFALDSTSGAGGSGANAQFAWLKNALEHSRAPWKIVYFHHPPYNAGPFHGASLKQLQQWVDLFRKTGVQIVFNGHEHNFQYARHDGIAYFLTGAGGQLRRGDIANHLVPAGVEAFASERHFLEVELDDREARVEAWGATGQVKPVDSHHQPVATPFRVPVSRSRN